MSAKSKYVFHLNNWSDIQDHLPMLFKNAQGECMEIGTRSGCSTSALLAGVEEHGGHLYSVDINDCPVFKGHKDWTFIKADSIKEADKVKVVTPKEINVLFVDGDHTFEGALSDLRNYGPRAKTIFVHDTDALDFPGVRKAVLTYCSESHRIANFHSGSYGMAEIS